MRSLPLTIFGKSAKCPSSQTLLAFVGSRLAAGRSEFISAHLDECEFCRAELQLLERFPNEPEQAVVREIPPRLRVLAESVLRKSRGLRAFGLAEFHRALN